MTLDTDTDTTTRRRLLRAAAAFGVAAGMTSRASAQPAGAGDLRLGSVRLIDLSVALEQLRATDERTLVEPRGVGRRQLPSTVVGLLVHAAEHTQRHAGQVATTARIVAATGE